MTRVLSELIVLDETAAVEQHIKTLTCRQLAFLVLIGNALVTAALKRRGALIADLVRRTHRQLAVLCKDTVTVRFNRESTANVPTFGDVDE